MQGVVYTIFNDLVCEKFGMDIWNELIDETKPESEGIYTSGETYPSSEIFAYVGCLSEKVNVPANDLVKVFGHYMFSHLISMNPIEIKGDLSLKEFLKLIDGTIHVEVKRLNPDAYLPSFETSDISDDCLLMKYQSKRKLCFLSEGLIEAAAEYFSTNIKIEHSQCMHQGAECCHIKIHFID